MWRVFFPIDSTNIIESKSLKLYLHSLNNKPFADAHDYSSRVSKDLSHVSEATVQVTARALDEHQMQPIGTAVGKCIDNAELNTVSRPADAQLLQITSGDSESKAIYSNLFRSNCPVTGQPDWATVQIEYTGAQLNESALLTYLCSYRQHQGYHEECAERIFRDIMTQCQPQKLTVAMNFLRRGGLDINPYRSTEPLTSTNFASRLLRQ